MTTYRCRDCGREDFDTPEELFEHDCPNRPPDDGDDDPDAGTGQLAVPDGGKAKATAQQHTANLDLEETVWFGDGDAYHADAGYGPACPDAIPYCSEHTLAEARDAGKRPCRQCHPTDYRSGRNDGVDSLALPGGPGDD